MLLELIRWLLGTGLWIFEQSAGISKSFNSINPKNTVAAHAISPTLQKKDNFHSTRSLNNHHQYHHQRCSWSLRVFLIWNSSQRKERKKSTSYHIHNCLHCHFQQKIYFNRKKILFFLNIKKVSNFRTRKLLGCWTERIHELHDDFVVFFIDMT